MFLTAPFLFALATGPWTQGTTEDTVYYDAPDEFGRLTGGVVRLQVPRGLEAWPVTGAPVSTPVSGGDPLNRIDVVFVGDGYTAGELGTYSNHVAAQVLAFFQEQPYAAYQDYFNVHQIDVVSNESGVDNDPIQGIERDTALNMGFFCSGIERLLCVNVGLAYGFANNAPDVDLVAALANSTKYGGAGYTSSDLATASGGNSAATEVLLHEFGHAMGNLADEYHYSDGATHGGGEVPEPNASFRTAAEMQNLSTKWFRWLGVNDPAFDGLVSTYEGARYQQFGLYRPTSNSLMRNLGRPFNLPSVEAMVLEIYKIVDPIDDSSPTAASYDGTETLFVTPMQPVGHALDVQWSLDGVPIPGATGNTLDLCALGLSPDAHVVTVTVVDPTPWVRDETARSTHMSETLTFEVDTGGNYCTGAPNSVGPGASMASTGSVRISAVDLVVSVDGAPPGKIGIFFHGSTRIQAPFGDGFRCAGGNVVRLPLQTVDGGGHAERPFDAAAAGVSPSQQRTFQFWYRDPGAGGSGHNLSDGLAAIFCP
jgi:hypothetical protein